MIDYSVSARPNPRDKEAAPKFYASPQVSENISMGEFCKHIASHGSVYSRADIQSVLTQAVDCMREMLLDGRKIRLGDLGDFSVSLSSKGAETADKFSSANISAVNVVWDCGQEFKNLLPDAEFNLVASRAAQAAVLKAIKSGSSVVDLGATGSNVPSGDDDEPTNPSGPTTGGGDDDELDPLG